jgi:hypothetical protein
MKIGVITYRSILEWDVIRLAQALNYAERMRRAGVPVKVRKKILRRYHAPFNYAISREVAGVIRDMRRWNEAQSQILAQMAHVVGLEE